jgi:hypothetical protein
MRGVPFRHRPVRPECVAMLTEHEAIADELADRAPDLFDVGRAAADVLGSQSVGRFVEVSPGCVLTEAEYETDGDGYVHSEPSSLVRWGWKGRDQRRYMADHAARLRTLILHG